MTWNANYEDRIILNILYIILHIFNNQYLNFKIFQIQNPIF